MRKLTFVYAIMSLLVFAACGKGAAKTEDTATVVEDEVTTPAPQDYKMDISGKVGKYPIEMILITREDGEVVGQYCYTKTGSHAWIPITGVMNGEKTKLQLLEKVDGKVTGDWQLKIDSFEPETQITGEMINFRDQSFDVDLSGTCVAGDVGSFDNLIEVTLSGRPE